FCGLHCERQRRECVCDEVEPEDLQREEGERESGYHTCEKHEDLRDVTAEEEVHEFPDVIVYHPPLLHRSGNGREAIIAEDDGGGFARDICSAFPHGHADTCFAECGGVVNSV